MKSVCSVTEFDSQLRRAVSCGPFLAALNSERELNGQLLDARIQAGIPGARRDFA